MKLFTLTQIPVYLVICYSAGKLWGSGHVEGADSEVGGTKISYPTYVQNIYTMLCTDNDYGCDSIGLTANTDGTFSAWARRQNYTSTSFFYIIVAS